MRSVKSLLRTTIVLSLMVILVSVPLSSVMAATQGPNNPASGTNETGIGTETWVDYGNITEPGSPYTTVVLYNKHTYSNYLQGTQYGFAIPAVAVIAGIEVKINRMSSSRNPNVIDNLVSLVKGGAIVGDNKALTLTAWETVLTTVTYGGATDLWGTTWTPADINSPDFGVVLAALRDNNGNNSRAAAVDTMQITVYYGDIASTSVDCEGGASIMYGENVTCMATVSRISGDLTPSGTVSWTTNGTGTFVPNPCTLAGADGIATCSATYTPSAVGNVVHLVTATYGGDDVFTPSANSQTVKVVARPITVTADPQTKVYGQLDPQLTYQVTQGSLVSTDTFTGTLTRAIGENVGSYAILQGSLALPSSYDLTYAGNFLTITMAEPTCVVTPYNVTYNGIPHTATGSCTGAASQPLTGLDLSGTTHTNAGVYTDPWTFTDSAGNYLNDNGTVSDNIDKANANCVVTPYSVVYDHLAHTATGSCTGAASEPLTGLDLSGTTHTNAGVYTDPWTFTDGTGNYLNDNGTVSDNIGKANATCVVTPYTAEYNRLAHTASGACTGVIAEALVGLNLTGTTHTAINNYPNDPWTFTDVTGNYNPTSGTVIDKITLRAITVVADAKSKLDGHVDPALTYKVTVGSLLSGDTFSGWLTREPGELIGTYAILQDRLSLPAYYVITYVGADFTIIGFQYICPVIYVSGNRQ